MRRGEGVRGILRLDLLWGCAWWSSCSGAVAVPVEAVGRDFDLILLSLRPPPPDLLLLDGLRRLLQRGCLRRRLSCGRFLNGRMRSPGLH